MQPAGWRQLRCVLIFEAFGDLVRGIACYLFPGEDIPLEDFGLAAGCLAGTVAGFLDRLADFFTHFLNLRLKTCAKSILISGLKIF